MYRATAAFPREEQFGLTSQIRRASVSVASNIVEGCARSTEADYLRFLDMAYASAMEVAYQLDLAHRLGYLSDDSFEDLRAQGQETAKVLGGLIRSLRKK